MASNRNLLVLPGDGIGPEVMNEVRKIIAWMGKKRAVGFDIKEDLVGGAALDKHGVPLSDDAMKTALEADAVLFGSVGGPKWDTADFSKKPERGLLRLRKEMDLFANLRPAKVFDALVDASSLKPEIVKGLDIMIIRELTSGVYFGEPRGRHTNAAGEVEAFDTQRYTAPEIRRVCAVAFELARKRKNKVLSAEKANVMYTGVLWREEATKLHKEKYSDVKLEHMYADALAMQLLRAPKDFDVIVEKMNSIPMGDPRVLDLFHDAMAIWLKELPNIPFIQWFHRIPMNTTYWQGWPTVLNSYSNGAFWHLTFPLILHKLKATQ